MLFMFLFVKYDQNYCAKSTHSEECWNIGIVQRSTFFTQPYTQHP